MVQFRTNLKNPTTSVPSPGGGGLFSRLTLEIFILNLKVPFTIFYFISRDESTLCRIYIHRISSKTEATLLLVDLQDLYYKSFISAKKMSDFQ